MRKMLLTLLMTLVWLLASPTLQVRDSKWVEVGASPAAAEPSEVVKKKPAKKVRKPVRLGSTPVIQSNAPGLYPMQPIDLPQSPNATGTVSMGAPVPGYPNVPTVTVVPIGGRETSQDRVARCAHQGSLGGLPSGEQGAYIHSCAFQ
jgi:hypothetical protein